MPSKKIKKDTKKNKVTKSSKKVSPVKTEVVVPVVAQAPVQTEADKIWNEIKDRPIEMFALPNQFVWQHCSPFPADPSKLFLTIRSTATLPALEVSCGKNFVVELADRYVIVTRAVVAPTFPFKK